MPGNVINEEPKESEAVLTEEQKKILERALTGYGEQGAHGFDLSLFRHNLSLTPTERVEQMQRALIIYREVQNAGRKYRLSGRH